MHVMFICHGNICRSPMGERVARRLADERGLDVRITSAGTSAEELGNPMDRRARQLLTKEGYDAEAHTARRLDLTMATDVDLFVVAEARHARILQDMGIELDRIRLVSDFDPTAEPGDPLPDPWYGDMGDFEDTLETLERAVPVLLDELG